MLFSGFTHEPAVELAERLLGHLPVMNKLFYSDDGSTSVEVALKMAFQFWHNSDQIKPKIITFENAYHGDTFGAMSVGARNVFNLAFDKMLFDVIHIPVPINGEEEKVFRLWMLRYLIQMWLHLFLNLWCRVQGNDNV